MNDRIQKDIERIQQDIPRIRKLAAKDKEFILSQQYAIKALAEKDIARFSKLEKSQNADSPKQ